MNKLYLKLGAILSCMFILLFSGCGDKEVRKEQTMSEQIECIQLEYGQYFKDVQAVIEISDSIRISELKLSQNKHRDTVIVLDFSKFPQLKNVTISYSAIDIFFREDQTVEELEISSFHRSSFESIKHFTKLKRFDRDGDFFSKSISLNDFSDSIELIQITNSNLDSFLIPEPEKYAKLHTLHLHYNFRLHYIDTNIYHLPNLKSLTIACTEVKNLNFSKLRSLQNLSTNKKYKHTKEDLEFFKKNNVDISRNWSSCISF